MERNVLEWLEHWAAQTPERTAVRDAAGSWTWRELWEHSRRVGSALLPTVERGRPVMVLCDKTREALACFFGAVYAGGFYVPVDGTLPQKRLEVMLGVMRPAAVLADEPGARALSGLAFEGKLLSCGEALSTAPDETGLARRREGALSTDPLYAIFTSGSTGTPKAVLVSHRAVLDFISQFTDTFGFTGEDVFGNQAPFDFDVSVKDVYSALQCGGTLCLIPKQYFSIPVKLLDFLDENGVTVLTWAVSALSILAQLKALDGRAPKTVRKVLFSGEVMPMKCLSYFREKLPGAEFVNLYGPTEITCNCTYHIVREEYGPAEVLPIGRPFKNRGILLLDEKREREVSPGEVGEICVRGDSLALGYYGDPQRTAESFIQNPLNHDYPERIYCTGDLGRVRPDGLLEFLSRRDFQIKHMGHRIELTEIEANAMSMPEMHACCALFDQKANKIVLFYEADGLTDRDVLLHLRQALPKYMCPNKFVALDKMPRSAHGKVDRAGLGKEYLS